MLDNLIQLQQEISELLPFKEVAEDIHYIKKCCGYLRKIGIIRNQYQFSENFLYKHKSYFAMVLSEGRQPSIDALHNLIKKMEDIRNVYEVSDDKQTETRYLNQLIDEGRAVLSQRLFKYI